METADDMYKAVPQIEGMLSHQGVDNKTGTSIRTDLLSLPVYSDELGISGVIDIYKSGRRLLIERKKNLKKIDTNTRILLIAGEEDPVGGYGKYVRVLQRQYIARKISSSMILYKSLRHEILNEKENAKIYADILSFLKG